MSTPLDAGQMEVISEKGRTESAAIPSRRSFLRQSALATPAILAAGSIAEAATKSKRKTTGGGSGGTTSPFPAINASNFVSFHIRNIVNNENTHLTGLLSELGTAARPKPTFQNITPTTVQQFVQMGSMFCAVGAGAYLGSGPYISNPSVLIQGGSLGQVELAQSAFLNSILGGTLLPNGSAFAPPLTLDQFVFMVTPFIASLNGGPPIAFSTTDRSPVNDLAILNVALVAEYLEHDFYNTYFPQFFPGA